MSAFPWEMKDYLGLDARRPLQLSVAVGATVTCDLVTRFAVDLDIEEFWSGRELGPRVLHHTSLDRLLTCSGFRTPSVYFPDVEPLGAISCHA